MNVFERRTPHYLRIYRDLRDKITTGALAPNEQLPTQRELAQDHGVTVVTVRHALQLLEQEELVTMRHGLGTFVAPKRIRYGMGKLRSLAQEISDQGLELETRVLRQELVEPHPHIAELLQIEPGEAVYMIERLRLTGRDPIVYQFTQLRPALGELLDGVDLVHVSLYDYLHDGMHVEIAGVQERIRAVTLSAHEATLLEQDVGSAALLTERLTLNSAGVPIMFDRAYMPADRVAVSTELLPPDTAVGYEWYLAEEGLLDRP